MMHMQWLVLWIHEANEYYYYVAQLLNTSGFVKTFRLHQRRLMHVAFHCRENFTLLTHIVTLSHIKCA